MSTLSREDEILLREYQQAGESCRGHDTLVRTGLTIFSAAQAAILGFISTQKETPAAALVPLELLGFWLSIVVLVTTWRLHYRYKNYIERARVIERRLGMFLFEFSQRYFESKPLLASSPGNKTWWASVPVLLLLIYGFLLVRDGRPFVRSLICAWSAL